MCRNVQITLSINLRPSPILALNHLNFLTAPQTKNGNNFFLPTSQKIDTFINFFLINKIATIDLQYSCAQIWEKGKKKNTERDCIEGKNSGFLYCKTGILSSMPTLPMLVMLFHDGTQASISLF